MSVMIALAFADRVVPGPLDPSVALFSFLTSLAMTAGVAWLANRVTRQRVERRQAELGAAAAAPGIH